MNSGTTLLGPGRFIEPVRERPRYPGLLFLCAWALFAVVALQLSYAWTWSAPAGILYIFALLQLARANSWRKAFYSALAVGVLIGILQLSFFWRIFSGAAFALWLVFAFWIALFVVLARSCFHLAERWPRHAVLALLVLPTLWCGLEYFRSELYFLRFAWVTPGFAYSEAASHAPIHLLGTYGLGWLSAVYAAAAAWTWQKSHRRWVVLLLLGIGMLSTSSLWPPKRLSLTARELPIVGIQMEFPTEPEVLMRLNEALRRYPNTQLFVLSEYTFNEPIPEKVKRWCKEHRKYLVAGGKDVVSTNQFYNTAFVISTNGDIVFRQIKSVPIQFFKDGLAAPTQAPWDSPWGKLGICICYDLSYSRVTDRLISSGAEALIVPTMDVFDWGIRQHELHARVAPVRAAEYGIPIFRVASSGISQLVDLTGKVVDKTPCPGEGAILPGNLSLRGPGRLPVDRVLAPFSVGFTGAFIFVAILHALVSRKQKTTC